MREGLLQQAPCRRIPLILLVAKELIATADSEPKRQLEAEVLAEIGVRVTAYLVRESAPERVRGRRRVSLVLELPTQEGQHVVCDSFGIVGERPMAAIRENDDLRVGEHLALALGKVHRDVRIVCAPNDQGRKVERE